MGSCHYFSISFQGAGAPFQQSATCAAAGSKLGADVDQRCTVTCQAGYHVECANITVGTHSI